MKKKDYKICQLAWFLPPVPAGQMQNIEIQKYKIQKYKTTKYKIQKCQIQNTKIQNTKYKIQNTVSAGGG